MQEGKSHLILRLPPPGGEAPSRLGQDVDQPLVVVAGPACSAQHLVELMHIEPLYAHGQRLEYHLGGGKVDASRQSGSGYHSMNPALSEELLDPLSLRILQAGMISRCARNGIGQGIAVLPGVGEDNALAAITGGRGQILGLPAKLPQQLSLLRAGGEYEMPLDCHRPYLVLHQSCAQTMGQGGRISHCGGEEDELGRRSGVL